MALSYDPIQYETTDTVCALSIIYRYKWYLNENDWGYQTDTLNRTYFTLFDFPVNTFKTFPVIYQYPDRFGNKYLGKFPEGMFSETDTIFIDDISLTGIEFQLDWYCVGKLYIDYVDLYDNIIGTQLQNEETFETEVKPNLITYANSFSNVVNLKYWYVNDEPNTMDSYEPMRIVDSIVTEFASFKKPIITEIYPHWRGVMNGDLHLQKFVELTKPKQLMIDRYVFNVGYPAEAGLFELRKSFQLADDVRAGFWYVAQGFSMRVGNPIDSNYCRWRRPDSTELNASVMLALAHGSKGILFWHFSPNFSIASTTACDVVGHLYFDGLVDENLNPTPLYDYVKDGLSPRLKGKLGKTLLTLDYTGDYLQMLRHQGEPPLPDITHRYFTLNDNGTDYFWHAGFHQQKYFIDNDYVLLVNLREDGNRTARITLENTTSYENLSARNIEGGIGELDTTIARNLMITVEDEFPPGEGKLYQVAPVVKYGGRLIYDEEIASETLHDEMIIENGATLGISGNYSVYADIIVKDGGRIVNTSNGKITFYNDHKLILQGNSTLSSLSQNKLVLDFVSPSENNGIIADSGLVIIISNCEIKNAGTGIMVSSFSSSAPESEAFHFRVDSVDFIDCEDFGINITGQYVNKAMIENSSFTGSAYGVSAVNLDEVVIFNNYFTNTEMGIRLINITKVDVIGNIITSNQYSMQGIFLDNSGGNLRANIVQGHSNGIHLGNSSPDIGSSIIYDNKYHGIYIGIGSLPNMLGGRWIGDPPVFYATSGYNKIYENGGWQELNPPPNNDGSEIFINNANVLLARGCNEIMDDREPSSPLINTILLMNGISFGLPISVSAEYNIWEDDPFYPLNSLRFGSLIVDFDPYYSESCPTPDGGGGGGFLLSKSSGGEVIDTLYSVEREMGTLTENEILYSKANESFISADYESAEIYYDQIISSSDTTENKLEAYSRKYTIGKLMKRSPEYFNILKNTYSTLSQSSENELLEKIFKQLSTKSMVGEQEYIPAISEYDEIIQQNPGSEEAVYAEIDALTTALLVEGNDSTLGKTAGGRYLVKTTADYIVKINDILRKNFGSKSETEESEILPKEYTLYQNYPNPFNPVTTISYDLPKPGDVKLMIYDILGREVKTLINTQQEAGRHTVNFNASSLASGVYLYRLSINDFVSAKKMILLR